MRFIFPVLVCIALVVSSPVMAKQTAREPQSVSTHVKNISKSCPGNWERESCLHAVSLSNYDLTVGYASSLEASGKGDALEGLKQVCAAATVTEGDIPAYAFTSAYTECANGIYDISEQTGVTPDQSHYQLLVGAVLCLSKDPRCSSIEQQLK